MGSLMCRINGYIIVVPLGLFVVNTRRFGNLLVGSVRVFAVRCDLASSLACEL